MQVAADYNQVKYPNYVFPETHPSRLAGLARIFSVQSPASNKAAVLEVGCGTGMNSLSLSVCLPESNFVAIDPAQKQIEVAEELRKRCQLNNIKFIAKGVEEIDFGGQKFDYIICHGVFSWIAPALQHQLLIKCKQVLAPTGLIFISYNTYPGWHVNSVIRDLALYLRDGEGLNISGPNQILEYLKFYSKNLPESYQASISPIIAHLEKVDPAYFLHEYLADTNSPLYFSEFRGLLEQHGFAYVCDCDPGSMLPTEFELEARQKIESSAAGSLLKLEQQLDFLRMRTFRKSLICHGNVSISRNLSAEHLVDLYVNSKKSLSQLEYSARGPITGGLVKKIADAFPSSLRLAEIVKNEADYQEIIEAIMLNYIEFTDLPFSLAQKGQNVSVLARELIQQGTVLPNLRNESVTIDPDFRKQLLSLAQLSTSDRLHLGKLALLT